MGQYALPKAAASRAHEQNDAYNAKFDKAWRELNGLQIEEDSSSSTKATTRNQKYEEDKPLEREACPAIVSSRKPTNSRSSSVNIPSTWLTGPTNPSGWWESSENLSTNHSGCEIRLSERPLICSSANWSSQEVVVGGSDHSLYVVDPYSRKIKRRLYTKSCGHSEWVTCVAYTQQGHIVSGAMDSKVCLWKTGSSRCLDLLGHSGSISNVCPLSNMIVSSSYDKTVRIWTIAKGMQIACLKGHKAPILEMDVSEASASIATGDRGGCTKLWDLTHEKVSWTADKAHQGHVTSLAWLENPQYQSNILLTGGQDGILQLWDVRSGSEVAAHIVHACEMKGIGAVSSIKVCGEGDSGKVVTAGADGKVNVLDPRTNFSAIGSAHLTDFPYCLQVIGDLVLCGCGDGSLHVIEVCSGNRKYCLGVNQGAVRTIEAAPDVLVCGGDDGNILIHRY